MSERQIEKVGPLSFCRSDLIGYGKFGTVFKGQYKNAVNLAVKRFEKKNTRIDSSLYLQVCNHQNVIHYYCTKENCDIEFL